MKNNKIVRFANSLVLLPILSISLPFGSVPTSSNSIDTDTKIVLSQKINNEVSGLFNFNQENNQEAQIIQVKAEAIDAYFESNNMPLVGYGMKMVLEAEKNNLDWRLLPAISVIETTGGRNLCKRLKPENKFNPFGWGSCKI